MELKALENEI